MKLKKLDMRGFSHDIALVLFVVIFAIAGVGYLVASHADSCSPVSGAVSDPASGAVSSPASSTTCQGPPLTAPSNLTATQITTNSFFRTFTPSTDNAGATVNDYKTYRYVTTAGPSTAVLYVNNNAPNGNYSGTIVGLNPNTTYSFYMTAGDSAGNVSAPSPTLTITTLPLLTAPSNLTAADITSNSFFRTFSPSTDNAGATINDYKTYRYVTTAGAGTAILYVNNNAPNGNYSGTIVGLNSSTTYSFYMTAGDSAGNVSAQSSTLNVTTSGSGEQLSKPPARRPAQYVHVCTSGSITYVAQGATNCLAGGTFEFNYAPSVPGTYYDVPCQATSTTALRYVYISRSEKCPNGTAAVGGAQLASGEQLSMPPARRPAQYDHVCLISNITYITQGTPNCLPSGTFEFNYAPSVTGTVYDRPCETTSGSLLRYAYISTAESCPSGTALVSSTTN
jgi:chitodextrinase